MNDYLTFSTTGTAVFTLPRGGTYSSAYTLETDTAWTALSEGAGDYTIEFENAYWPDDTGSYVVTIK